MYHIYSSMLLREPTGGPQRGPREAGPSRQASPEGGDPLQGFALQGDTPKLD